MSINRAIIQGRLTRDVELRHTQSGKAVASFTVAWSETHNGNESKLFMPCVAWDKNGEFVSRYFCKGREIVVEGRLGARQWTDKEGNKRETVELTVERAHFCGPKQDSQGGGYKPAAAVNAAPGDWSESEDDGPLPF